MKKKIDSLCSLSRVACKCFNLNSGHLKNFMLVYKGVYLHTDKLRNENQILGLLSIIIFFPPKFCIFEGNWVIKLKFLSFIQRKRFSLYIFEWHPKKFDARLKVLSPAGVVEEFNR